MAINKVVYGNQVLIDITDSTVNPNTLLAGYKAYGANGQPVNGALQLSYHITLHQAQYDALSEAEQMADENWFYIDDVKIVGAELDDSAISPAKVWSSQKTNREIQDVQDQVDINTTDIGTLNSALANMPVLKSSDFDTGSVQLTRDSSTDMYYGTVNIEAPADASYAVGVCWANTSWNACVIGVVSNPYIADNKKMFMVWFASSKSMTIPSRRIRIWYI